jgi:MYXO-CTERM domain-containing protein
MGAGCVIGGACVAEGALDPANECAACISAVSTTGYSPRAMGAACTDGAFCTVMDACDGAGICATMPRDCADALACTVDSCDEAADACTSVTDASSCLIGGACVAGGTENPDNPCEVCDPATSASAFSPRPAGERCGDPSCVGTTFTPAALCDGASNCVPGTPEECLGGLMCADGVSCSGMCAGDLECLEEFWCDTTDTMNCLPDLPNGDPCSRIAMCESDVCTEGVCCDTACAGTCESCTAVAGECRPYDRGTDPESECTDPEVCDGAGMCVDLTPDAGMPDAGADAGADAAMPDSGIDAGPPIDVEVRGSGCACHSTGGGDASGLLLGLLLVLAVLSTRRVSRGRPH